MGSNWRKTSLFGNEEVNWSTSIGLFASLHPYGCVFRGLHIHVYVFFVFLFSFFPNGTPANHNNIKMLEKILFKTVSQLLSNIT